MLHLSIFCQSISLLEDKKLVNPRSREPLKKNSFLTRECWYIDILIMTSSNLPTVITHMSEEG